MGSPRRKMAAFGVMSMGESQGTLCSVEKGGSRPSACRMAGSQAGTGNFQGDKY